MGLSFNSKIPSFYSGFSPHKEIPSQEGEETAEKIHQWIGESDTFPSLAIPEQGETEELIGPSYEEIEGHEEEIEGYSPSAPSYEEVEGHVIPSAPSYDEVEGHVIPSAPSYDEVEGHVVPSAPSYEEVEAHASTAPSQETYTMPSQYAAIQGPYYPVQDSALISSNPPIESSSPEQHAVALAPKMQTTITGPKGPDSALAGALVALVSCTFATGAYAALRAGSYLVSAMTTAATGVATQATSMASSPPFSIVGAGLGLVTAATINKFVFEKLAKGNRERAVGIYMLVMGGCAVALKAGSYLVSPTTTTATEVAAQATPLATTTGAATQLASLTSPAVAIAAGVLGIATAVIVGKFVSRAVKRVGSLLSNPQVDPEIARKVENRINALYRQHLTYECEELDRELRETGMVAVPAVTGLLFGGFLGIAAGGCLGLLSVKICRAVSRTFPKHASKAAHSKEIQAEIRDLSAQIGKKAPKMRPHFQ